MTKENDPDALQLLDESDKEWVKLWRKAALKEIKTNTLTHFVLQHENIKTTTPKDKSRVLIDR
jgi:hypothetical protein